MKARIPKWFQDFCNGEFYHLKIEVKLIKWLVLTILAVIIGSLVARFLFG